MPDMSQSEQKAIFLTKEEREVTRRFLGYEPLAGPHDSAEVWRRRWECIQATREKLTDACD